MMKKSDSRKGEGRKKPSMYMVFPYMEHDLSGLLENPEVHFSEAQIKCYMIQLLEGLKYLHGVLLCSGNIWGFFFLT
jgi:serine/threonine protein kinase